MALPHHLHDPHVTAKPHTQSGRFSVLNTATVLSNSCDWSELTALIPAYRCAPFLPAAVESLLLCPLKIVIAEDCSGDDTLEVAHALERRHPGRITVVCNPQNLGVSRSINHTMEAIRTKYIIKMDADDVIFPEYVRRAYEYIWRREDLALICGTCDVIGPTDYLSIDSEPQPQKSLDGPIYVLSGADACRFILRWNPYPCSSGIIYRTEALKSAGGFAPDLNWAEDREVWFRLARRSPVAYYDVPGALYRRHPMSLTALNRAQQLTGVRDGRLIAESRRLWPERELLPDYARSFYEIGRDCRRTSREAVHSGRWGHAIRCASASARYLAHGALLSLLSATVLDAWSF